jgi:hypothetical protein
VRFWNSAGSHKRRKSARDARGAVRVQNCCSDIRLAWRNLRKAGTVSFVRGACRGIMAARRPAMRLNMRETEPVAAEINYQDKPERSDIVNAASVDRQRNCKSNRARAPDRARLFS